MSVKLKKIEDAKKFIAKKTNMRPQTLVVLGSGLGSFVKQVKVEDEISYSKIPGFAKPTVQGHGGKLVFGYVGKTEVVIMQGRVHYYEGHTMEQVVLPLRSLGLLSVKRVLLTNAAGGIRVGMKPGDLMVIRDHINLMGTNPLLGPNIEKLGPRFPDMTEAYSKRIQNLAKAAFAKVGIQFQDGVYAGLTGPTYETPAEVEHLRKCGADAVGMSTVPETIAARHMGIEVGGISCITNLAAGMSGQALDHAEVTAVGKKVEDQFAKLLTYLIPEIAK